MWTNGPSGDLVIKINVEDHEMFKRNGFNIHTKKMITVTEAILGSTFEVETIRGNVRITMPPGIQNGEIRKIVDFGINKLPPLQKQRGHHFVTFEVQIPTNLTSKQKEIFSEYAKIEDNIEETY